MIKLIVLWDCWLDNVKQTMKQGLQRVLCLREAITIGRSSRGLRSNVEVNVEAKVEAELTGKTCC